MKLQQVGALHTFEIPSGHRVQLQRTPGGALWATAHDGVLYFRWEPDATPSALDCDRWLVLAGGDNWDAVIGSIF